MPTDVVSSIGTSGRTYSTVQSWEDACPANLVTDDKRWIGECYKDSEFTTNGVPIVTISGTTTDSTRYIILRCATGQSFKDNANVRTNALAYSASNGVAMRTVTTNYTHTFQVNAQYTRIYNLQIKQGVTNNAPVVALGSANCRLDGCIIDMASNVSSGAVGCSYNTQTIVNCLLIVRKASSPGIFEVGASAVIAGNTIVSVGVTGNRGVSVSTYGTKPTVTNTAVFGFSNFSGGNGINSASDYNASDTSSAGGMGTHNQLSLTFANQVVSTTIDFRAISTGSLDLNGTPDSTNTPIDISGTTRSASTPTIGCWEVTTASNNLLASPICLQLNLLNTTQTAGASLPFFPVETRSQLSTPTPAGGITFTTNPLAAQSQFNPSAPTAGATVAATALTRLTQFVAGTATAGAAVTTSPLPVHTQFTSVLAVGGASLPIAPLNRTNQLTNPTTTAGAATQLSPLSVLISELAQPILAGGQLSAAPLQDYIQLSNPTVGSQVVVALPAFMVQLSLLSQLFTGGAVLSSAPLNSVVKLNNSTPVGGVTVATTSLNYQTQLNLSTVTAGANLTPPPFRSILIVQTGPIELNQPIFLNLQPLVVEPTISLTGTLRAPSPLVCYAVTLQPEFGYEVVVQPEFNLDVEFQEC